MSEPLYFKTRTMTVCMHDHAYPKEMNPLFLSAYSGQPRSVQIYSEMTMDMLRDLSDEQIGKFIRSQLTKLDEAKSKIESK